MESALIYAATRYDNPSEDDLLGNPINKPLALNPDCSYIAQGLFEKAFKSNL